MKKPYKKNKNIIFIFTFLIGLCIMFYPFISDIYYKIDSGKKINDFEKGIKNLSNEEIEKRINLAKAYNSTLDTSKLFDPFSKEEKKKGLKEYARMLKVKELIGHIEIPKINEDLPIFTGTSDEVLEKGAGHLEGTSLPIGGPSTHTVITAHRGLPKTKLFRNIDKLKKGDIFFIHNLKDILAYEVDEINIVDPSDFSKILVESKKDFATLLTCSPYMINTQRLLVRGKRIEFTNINRGKFTNKKTFFRKYFYLLLLIFLIIFIIFLYNFKKYLNTKNKFKGISKNI